MGLIYVATRGLYPAKFCKLTGLMVLTQIKSYGTIIFWAYSTAVTHVDYIEVVVECHDNIGTAAWFTILHFLCCLVLGIYFCYVCLISLQAPVEYGSLDVLWEFRLQYDIVMQVLFQIFGTLIATVSIVDSKYLYFGPLFFWKFWLFHHWLDHVEDDGDTVFVRFSH